MTLFAIGHAAKCLGEGDTQQNAWDLPLTLLASGHARKCLGEGVTRQNAWDLPLTLLPGGHAAKCLGEGDTQQNAWDPLSQAFITNNRLLREPLSQAFSRVTTS